MIPRMKCLQYEAGMKGNFTHDRLLVNWCNY